MQVQLKNMSDMEIGNLCQYSSIPPPPALKALQRCRKGKYFWEHCLLVDGGSYNPMGAALQCSHDFATLSHCCFSVPLQFTVFTSNHLETYIVNGQAKKGLQG